MIDQDLLSFGPHFGQEALNEFIQCLENLGLSYSEDFIGFDKMTLIA